MGWRRAKLDLLALKACDEIDAEFSDRPGGRLSRRLLGRVPGITQSDLLVINKVDLAPLVGADLGVIERDARTMRGSGPFVFAEVSTTSV